MNEALRKLIKRHEGLSLIPYTCPAGFNTIGYGWNFDANPLPQVIAYHLKDCGSITPEMAEKLLAISIGRAEADVRLVFPDFDKYSENRQLALIDMSFQMGRTTLSKFTTTLRMIKDGHWDHAADNLQLSKWYKQSGRRSKEVCKLLREG